MGRFSDNRWRIVEFLIIGLAIGSGASIMLFNWSVGWTFTPRHVLKETERRGNQIVDALNRFQADHGEYPVSLQELSPNYLQEILPPTWGLKAWIYAQEQDGFDLSVNESVLTGNGVSRYFRYYDRWSKWELGD